VNKKLILIRVDANHKRGMGHLFRMLTLADVFVSMDAEIVFAIREDEITEKILDEKSIPYAVFPERTSELEIIQDILKKTKNFPNIWIYDILNTEISWIRSIKEKDIKVVAFDDERGGIEEADVVINPIVHSWGNYNPSLTRARLLEGVEYAVLNPRVFEQRKERIIRSDSPFSIGITMGGSDTYGVTVSMIEALNVINIGANRITVFTGPHFEHMPELEKVVEKFRHRVEIKNMVKNIHEELNTMNVVICGGGITLFEVSAMGLPPLAFANEPHEELTIRYFQSLGACGSIGSRTKLKEGWVSEKLKEYLNNISLLNSFASSNYKRFRQDCNLKIAMEIVGL
jgi:spore coat polysaccharide biosynthesis predicted glycosyltransferase SpsG